MPHNPIDGASYALIVELIDAAEDYLVRHRHCEASEANDWVALDYIASASGIIGGATVYVRSDERIGAEIFLSNLPGARAKLRSTRRMRSCRELLAQAPHRFFDRFNDLLRYAFETELRSITNPAHLIHNGLMLLASAALPEYRATMRRVFRRFGYEDRLLVGDDDLAERVFKVSPLVNLIEHRRAIAIDDR